MRVAAARPARVLTRENEKVKGATQSALAADITDR